VSAPAHAKAITVHVSRISLSTALTDCWSELDRFSAFCRTNRLSSVKSFIRSLEAKCSPAQSASIGTFIGHGGLSALGIIARRM
jgi:hypothetical protein